MACLLFIFSNEGRKSSSSECSSSSTTSAFASCTIASAILQVDCYDRALLARASEHTAERSPLVNNCFALEARDTQGVLFYSLFWCLWTFSRFSLAALRSVVIAVSSQFLRKDSTCILRCENHGKPCGYCTVLYL